MQLNGAASLREQHPLASRAASLDLYQIGGSTVGLFEWTSADDRGVEGQLQVREGVGPGLRGFHLTDGDRTRMLVSRDLDTAAAEPYVRDPGRLAREGRLVAHQKDAEVPGIGSIPAPTNVAGYVTSYAAQKSPRDPQRSLVLAVWPTPENEPDVLRFWFGNGDAANRGGKVGWIYHATAYATAGGAPSAPKATYFLTAAAPGVTLLVRSVLVDDAELDAAVQSARLVPVSEWAEKVKAVRRTT